MLKKIFENRKNKQRSVKSANLAYGTIVGQSRKPMFYTTYFVADTIDGRFDMVALNLFMALNRLDGIEGGKNIQQHIANITIADMDQAVREFGVGDTGVSKRVKAMASAFWGRFEAYSKATDKTMADVILKNVYRANTHKKKHASMLAKYVKQQTAYLKSQNDADILSGNVKFKDSTETKTVQKTKGNVK